MKTILQVQYTRYFIWLLMGSFLPLFSQSYDEVNYVEDYEQFQYLPVDYSRPVNQCQPCLPKNANTETPGVDPRAQVDSDHPYADTSIETYYTNEEPDGLSSSEDEESGPSNSDIGSNTSEPKDTVKPPYRLKIGDQIYLSLYGFRDANTNRLVTVDATGHISYLFIEPLPALGKTIDEFRKLLQDKVNLQYHNVVVTVSATSLVGNSYTIMGEVTNPGTKIISGDLTVLRAIAEAGGFPLRGFRSSTIDFADLEKSFLSRKGEYIPVDFESLIREGNLKEDVKIQGGDYIYIPTLITKKIYVLGEINRQFVYTYIRTATLTEVVAYGGGLTQLASSRVAVIRDSLSCPKTYLIEYNLMVKGCQPDFVLEPGDVVFFPAAKFNAFKQIIRSGISAFVGALATQAGTTAFLEVYPKAIGNPNIGGSNLIINPGTVPQQQPTVIIAQ